jgi:hypothetical protein
MTHLLPFVIPLLLLILYKDYVCELPSPVAAAGGEWINDDQQGELFERSEFSHCRRSSFRHRVPA